MLGKCPFLFTLCWATDTQPRFQAYGSFAVAPIRFGFLNSVPYLRHTFLLLLLCRAGQAWAVTEDAARERGQGRLAGAAPTDGKPNATAQHVYIYNSYTNINKDIYKKSQRALRTLLRNRSECNRSECNRSECIDWFKKKEASILPPVFFLRSRRHCRSPARRKRLVSHRLDCSARERRSLGFAPRSFLSSHDNQLFVAASAFAVP